MRLSNRRPLPQLGNAVARKRCLCPRILVRVSVSVCQCVSVSVCQCVSVSVRECWSTAALQGVPPPVFACCMCNRCSNVTARMLECDCSSAAVWATRRGVNACTSMLQLHCDMCGAGADRFAPAPHLSQCIRAPLVAVKLDCDMCADLSPSRARHRASSRAPQQSQQAPPPKADAAASPSGEMPAISS
jgi:hypothetical protein